MDVEVAARVGRRDRRGGGDADRAADLLRRVDQPRGHAGVVVPHTGQRADRHRDEGERHPDPTEQEGREDVPEVVSVHRKLGVEHEPRRGEQQPERKHALDSDPERERLRDVREHDHGKCQRHVCDTGLHRRVVQHLLHVERQQEELREHRAAEKEARDVRPGERPEPEHPHREQRGARPERCRRTSRPAQPRQRAARSSGCCSTRAGRPGSSRRRAASAPR